MRFFIWPITHAFGAYRKIGLSSASLLPHANFIFLPDQVSGDNRESIERVDGVSFCGSDRTPAHLRYCTRRLALRLHLTSSLKLLRAGLFSPARLSAMSQSPVSGGVAANGGYPALAFFAVHRGTRTGVFPN